MWALDALRDLSVPAMLPSTTITTNNSVVTCVTASSSTFQYCNNTTITNNNHNHNHNHIDYHTPRWWQWPPQPPQQLYNNKEKGCKDKNWPRWVLLFLPSYYLILINVLLYLQVVSTIYTKGSGLVDWKWQKQAQTTWDVLFRP